MNNITTTALAPSAIPASQTNAVVPTSKPLAFGGARHRFDVVVGRVVGAPVVKLQHAGIPGIWEDTKTAAASANAGTVCTFTVGSQTIAATAHGLSVGQWVSFSTTGQLPGAFTPNAVYEVTAVPSANSFVVKPYENQTMAGFAITDVGSGAHRVHAAAVVSIALNPETAGDQAHMPLRPRQRIVVSTAVGEACQTLAVVATHSL